MGGGYYGAQASVCRSRDGLVALSYLASSLISPWASEISTKSCMHACMRLANMADPPRLIATVTALVFAATAVARLLYLNHGRDRPVSREVGRNSQTDAYPTTIHLLTFTTQHQQACAMLECWRRAVEHMIARETSGSRYELHVLHQRVNSSGTGRYLDQTWLSATHAKVIALTDWLRTHAKTTALDFVLYTDPDVVPLGPWSTLAERASPNVEISFMREPPGHTGMSEWVVNTGLILMRNSMRVRAFLTHLRVRLRNSKRLHDQDVANWLLLKHSSTARLNWSTFESSTVTGDLDEVGKHTVAFHAIGVTGEAKQPLLARALERRRDRSGKEGRSWVLPPACKAPLNSTCAPPLPKKQKIPGISAACFLAQQTSRGRTCIPGEGYGCGHGAVWTRGGCSGRFVCKGRELPCGDGQTCSCSGSAFATSTRCDLRLMKQHSAKNCTNGSSFGCVPAAGHGWKVWVDRGCRGQFECNARSVDCGSPGRGRRRWRSCSCSQPAGMTAVAGARGSARWSEGVARLREKQ